MVIIIDNSKNGMIVMIMSTCRDGEELDSQGDASSQPDTISIASRTSQNTLDSDKVGTLSRTQTHIPQNVQATSLETHIMTVFWFNFIFTFPLSRIIPFIQSVCSLCNDHDDIVGSCWLVRCRQLKSVWLFEGKETGHLTEL